ncbi:unnamed protein product [Hymenolepis diminuta]|uniref:SET domain-containing protein n=1 Tax=Hymenolepis diminuta TaxID=6216 RepID=A0A0R3S830_HYMDI|nr:unnamed protein product [Hymenolepis diminuta]
MVPLKENQRHQGFENVDNSRGQPPPVFNPSDYSTVAWLYPQSGTETTDEFQWKSTINAIFLTYCLWLSDYPMRWFDEAKREFYKHPSQIKRPNFLPASWIATCMLYHLKAMRFNAADYTEYLESSSIELTSNRNWLALCIYPTISLINHDCNPNACLVSTANGGTFLYALRPIAKNEEVTICYQYFYFSISTSFRIANIRERYLFSCHCDACSNKWDLKKLETESLKCPSCGSKFLSTDEKCTNCNDEGGYMIFQRIIHEKIPYIMNCLKSKSCGMKSTVEAVSLLKEIQNLIFSPSPTVSCVVSLCMQVIDRTTGIRTVDNMIKSQFTYMTGYENVIFRRYKQPKASWKIMCLRNSLRS